MVIDQFQGQYRFLSNFWVEKDGSTVEHEFQSAKTTVPLEREFVLNAATPGEAKRLGRKVTLRPDWEGIKLTVMRYYVKNKFTDDQELMEKLKATGDAGLVEGNYWHDKYWGVDLATGEGENHLGRILMEVRAS